MIFASHDFTENYLNAVGYNDDQMETMILIDEIARLLIDDKRAIVEQLRKSNINVTYKDNPEIIKAYLVREIENGNDNILTFLSKHIALTQLDEPRVKDIAKRLSADGDGKTKAGQILSGIAKSDVVQDSVSDLISQGISKAFTKKNPKKVSNENQLTERLKANEMIAAQAKKKKYATLKVVLIVTAIAGLGFAAYKVITKRKASVEPAVPAAASSLPGYTPINQ